MEDPKNRTISAVPASTAASAGGRDRLASSASAREGGSERACSASEEVRSCLRRYLDCRIALSEAGAGAEKIKEARGTLDRALLGKRTRAVAYDVGILQTEAGEPDARRTAHAGDEALLGLAERVEMAASVRIEIDALHAKAKGRNDERTARAKHELDAARLELLCRVEDMEALHSKGEETRDVKGALQVLYVEDKELGDADAGLRKRARTLLAHIQASESIKAMVTSGDVEAQMKRMFLSRQLAEICLLVERDLQPEDPQFKLVSEALAIASALDKRTELAALVLYARHMGNTKIPVEIPEAGAEAARANVSSLVTAVESITSNDRRTEQVRTQALTNLANAYGDMLVLEEARNTPSGRPEDLALLQRALGIVASNPPSASKRVAAEMMSERLK